MGAAFVLAGLSALHAVFPSLKRRRARRFAGSGLVYFGHLRHRSAEQIRTALAKLDQHEIRNQLAHQLHVTSDIAWRKHARLQRAQLLLIAAVAAFMVAELWT